MYHNSQNGPRLCKATKRECPYGAAGQPHFETQQAAQAYYEETMREAFGDVYTYNPSFTEDVRQGLYIERDNIKRAMAIRVEMAKMSPKVQKTLAVINFVRNAPGHVRRGFVATKRNTRAAWNTFTKELDRRAAENQKAYDSWEKQRLVRAVTREKARQMRLDKLIKENRRLVVENNLKRAYLSEIKAKKPSHRKETVNVFTKIGKKVEAKNAQVMNKLAEIKNNRKTEPRGSHRAEGKYKTFVKESLTNLGRALENNTNGLTQVRV